MKQSRFTDSQIMDEYCPIGPATGIKAITVGYSG